MTKTLPKAKDDYAPVVNFVVRPDTDVLAVTATYNKINTTLQNVGIEICNNEKSLVKVIKPGRFCIALFDLNYVLEKVKGTYVRFASDKSHVDIDYAKGKSIAVRTEQNDDDYADCETIAPVITVFIGADEFKDKTSNIISILPKNERITANLVVEINENRKVMLAGTDGKRLLKQLLNIYSYKNKLPENDRFGVSPSFITVFNKFFDKKQHTEPVMLQFSEKYISMVLGEVTLISHLVDLRTMPEYNAVYGWKVAGTLSFNRNEVEAVVDKIKKLKKSDDCTVLQITVADKKGVFANDETLFSNNECFIDYIEFTPLVGLNSRSNYSEVLSDADVVHLETLTVPLATLLTHIPKGVKSVQLDVLCDDVRPNEITALRYTITENDLYVMAADKL